MLLGQILGKGSAGNFLIEHVVVVLGQAASGKALARRDYIPGGSLPLHGLAIFVANLRDQSLIVVQLNHDAYSQRSH